MIGTLLVRVGDAIECANCGLVFWMTDQYEQERREDGRSFYCPNGHVLSFTESEVNRLRRQLKNAESTAATERRWRESAEKSLAATKGVVTKMRKRAITGVCQFCHRHFTNVERHVASKHPGEKETTDA